MVVWGHSMCDYEDERKQAFLEAISEMQFAQKKLDSLRNEIDRRIVDMKLVFLVNELTLKEKLKKIEEHEKEVSDKMDALFGSDPSYDNEDDNE